MASSDQGLRHLALFYHDAEEYAPAIAEFLQAGPAATEPTLVAVPGIRQHQLRRRSAAATLFTDMAELGRNPARILPAIQAFIDSSPGNRIRFVGEPIWPGRSCAEMREATRNEALINLALADAAATIVCPYDVTGLPERVIADARRTHPLLLRNGRDARSPVYAGAGAVPADCDDLLPPVPVNAQIVRYERDLRQVRALMNEQARLAGLARSRAVDLVLAVSEVAANTLRHTSAGGTVSLWRTSDELVCQIDDTGHITDPLAGRRSPDRDHPGGRGLWLVNQVCDLVEIRTGRSGTAVRLHMRLAGTAWQQPGKITSGPV